MRRLILKIFIGGLCVTGLMAALADVCAASEPERKRYTSENKLYALELVSASSESDQCSLTEEEEKSRPAAEGDDANENVHCTGVFYIVRNRSDDPLLTIPLADERLPDDALVSNSGQYVVTFGYDPYALVIYRTDGRLIKQLESKDFLTEDDASAFLGQGESIWWGTGRRLDEEHELLVIKFSSGGIPPDPDGTGSYELKVELSSGDLTEPKRNFFIWSGPDWELPGTSKTEGSQPCVERETGLDAARLVYPASSDLFKRAIARITPPYPAVARAARASGTVVVEVLVDEQGSVRCARAISGHPLLQAAAVQAARNWRFAPLDVFGRPAWMSGTIAFHFRRAGRGL